ncbi:MAG: hypothetical protein MI702_03775 [Chlorobiales bacterium]|nr:hypothetical protein [Chlorobiales bacterium]
MMQFSAIRGINTLKTVGGLKRRASNSDRAQVHLDIYVLVQERDRLEKEKHQVVSRLESVNDRLKTIDNQVNELKTIIDAGRVKSKNQRGAAAKKGRRVVSDKEDSKTWQVKNLQY